MPLQFIQTSFAECQSIAINLIPVNGSVGIPPYYMTAYAIENTTIVSIISSTMTAERSFG